MPTRTIEFLQTIHPAHKSVILLLADDRNIREAAKICLELDDYTVLDTGSLLEALDLWNQGPERIDLFIADSGLPGMPGAHLAEMFMEQKPDLKVLIATANPSTGTPNWEKTIPNVRFIERPYPIQTLVETVDRFFDTRKERWRP